MAIVQENKQNVCPTMDYCKLNEHVDVYTASTDICAQKLREWQWQGSDVAVLDLRQANLQIHIERSLWPFQTMEIKGTRYCLTQLGFGFNVAPNIMTAIMNAVRVQYKNIQKATSSYIDNIFVNECIVSSQALKKHFEHFGLTCKKPEPLQNGAKVLGLHISGNRKRLRWRRWGNAPEVLPVINCRNTFSVCGKLVGHFPICGWLRVAVAAIRQCATSVSSGWDDEVWDATLRSILTKTVARVTQDDSKRGDWCVDRNEFTVWVDANSLAMGVALKANSAIIGDAC